MSSFQPSLLFCSIELWVAIDSFCSLNYPHFAVQTVAASVRMSNCSNLGEPSVQSDSEKSEAAGSEENPYRIGMHLSIRLSLFLCPTTFLFHIVSTRESTQEAKPS